MKRNAILLAICCATMTVGHAESLDAKNVHRDNLLKSVVIIAPDHDLSSKSAEEQIAEAAASVSHAIQELAAVERANAEKPAVIAPIKPINDKMTEVASVDYQGPAEPLLRRIAKICDLSFNTLGHNANTPIMVSLYSRRVPITELLRDISFQIQKQATMVLDPKSQSLELHYQPLTHS